MGSELLGRLETMKIKGFTPISDKILLELGLMAAAVYGKIWRYCDAYGSCKASKQRIAQELAISERTVFNYLKILKLVLKPYRQHQM